jgi:hypothetical protein
MALPTMPSRLSSASMRLLRSPVIARPVVMNSRGVAWKSRLARAAEAAVRRGDDHALLVEPGAGHPVADAVGPAGCGDLGPADRGGAEHLVLPVGVGAGGGEPVIGVVAVVGRGLAHVLEVLGPVEQVDLLQHALAAVVAAEGDRAPALLAALGGDEHHAVGAARAVDRGRGGVLEHVDGGDVLGAQAGDGPDALAAHAELREVLGDDRHAVDHVERLVVGGDRGGAAHPHADRVARVAGVLDHLHARRPARERGIGAGVGLPVHLFRADRADRGAEVVTGHRAVADGDHLLELDGLEHQGKVHGGVIPRRQREAPRGRGVADHLDPHEQGTGGHVGQLVFAVGPRHRPLVGADHRDQRAFQRPLVRRIRHRALDRLCRGGCPAEHQQQHAAEEGV